MLRWLIERWIATRMTMTIWRNRILLHAYRIPYGRNLRCMGRMTLRICGRAQNIRLGDNVTMLGDVTLYNRENGRIEIGDNVVLDHAASICAAREARVSIGEGSRIGYYFTLNAGADVLLGRQTLVAGHVSINASDHGTKLGIPIMEQEYTHTPIVVGDGCWIGTMTTILRGSRIGSGVVIGCNSVVRGELPDNAIVAGCPAKVLKFRQ